jgi:hypothetical protein
VIIKVLHSKHLQIFDLAIFAELRKANRESKGLVKANLFLIQDD